MFPYMDTNAYTRRDFVKLTAAAGIAVGTSALAAEKHGDMPYRVLGRTGEKVSCIGVGGYHIGNPKRERKRSKSSARAIDRGINVHGQLLGLSRWRQRSAHGQGVA